MKQYRHGDILLIACEPVKEQLNESDSRLLAEGEGHNHGHFIEGEVSVFEAEEKDAYSHTLQVHEEAHLKHLLIDSGTWTGEHADILVAPGTYRVIRQREFDPYENRVREVND